MSTKFIRSFKFLSFLIVLSIVTSTGYSAADYLDDRGTLPDRQGMIFGGYVLYQPGDFKEDIIPNVNSFRWYINRNTGNTLINDTNSNLIATIFTLARGEYKDKIGVFFNTAQRKIFQSPFMDITSAQRWVVQTAKQNSIVLAK